MGSTQSTLSYDPVTFLCNPSEHELKASEQEFPDPENPWPGGLEQPVCRVVREGRYRDMVCLLMRGARIKTRSLLDNKRLMELAVASRDSACAYTLASLGEPVLEQDVILAATNVDAPMLRVLVNRGP